jgi:hypothetical protein
VYSSLLTVDVNFNKQGLIVSARKESLQHFKKPWAHEHEHVDNLLDAVNVWVHFWNKNNLMSLP